MEKTLGLATMDLKNKQGNKEQEGSKKRIFVRKKQVVRASVQISFRARGVAEKTPKSFPVGGC